MKIEIEIRSHETGDFEYEPLTEDFSPEDHTIFGDDVNYVVVTDDNKVIGTFPILDDAKLFRSIKCPESSGE